MADDVVHMQSRHVDSATNTMSLVGEPWKTMSRLELE